MCYNTITYKARPMGTGRLELPRQLASKFQTCHVCLFHHVPVIGIGEGIKLTELSSPMLFIFRIQTTENFVKCYYGKLELIYRKSYGIFIFDKCKFCLIKLLNQRVRCKSICQYVPLAIVRE